MIRLFGELNNLIKEYEDHVDEVTCDDPKPFYIPDDVYDEICFRLDIERIDLLGIS